MTTEILQKATNLDAEIDHVNHRLRNIRLFKGLTTLGEKDNPLQIYPSHGAGGESLMVYDKEAVAFILDYLEKMAQAKLMDLTVQFKNL